MEKTDENQKAPPVLAKKNPFLLKKQPFFNKNAFSNIKRVEYHGSRHRG